MSPLDKEAPQLRGMDREGSVQVHQDARVSKDGIKLISPSRFFKTLLSKFIEKKGLTAS